MEKTIFKSRTDLSRDVCLDLRPAGGQKFENKGKVIQIMTFPDGTEIEMPKNESWPEWSKLKIKEWDNFLSAGK